MELKRGASIHNIKYRRFLFNPWVICCLLASLLVAFPLLMIPPEMLVPGSPVWKHMLSNLVPGYVINTIVLMIGVGALTLVMGVSSAWLVTMYRFPWRRMFQWALILPIAIPAYITGFAWAGMLEYTSPAYVFMRNTFGTDTGAYLFFNILSLPGAIFILSLSLYPYVYLITRAYFVKQSSVLVDVAASLGHGPWRTFLRTALPLARPAIVAGVSLALMEVLNDYGLVRYFGVDTFTTGIFTAWFAFADPSAALKLSGTLMVFVLVLILGERSQRGKMRYASVGSNYRPVRPRSLTGFNALMASLWCFMPLLAGFLLPGSMLVYWATQTAGTVLDAGFLKLLGNSFVLATLAAVLVVGFGLFIAFTARTFPSRFVRLLAKVATLGYALPGAVVAIGILIPFIWMDQQLISTLPLTKMVLTGTWVGLLYAYLVRFMAVGYNSIESGLEKISVTMDEASRSLGMSHRRTLQRVNLPLLKGSLLSAALLVFIDVLKELPLTLILRPFNFDTLAIRAFEYASDERVAEAAPAALIIIVVGMVPVIFLNKIMGKE